MKEKVKKLLENKNKTIPILSFPSVQLMGITVNELLSSGEMQAEGMKAVFERCNMGAVLNMMDLSVEAEAFGAEVMFSENEIPTVVKGVISQIDQSESVTVPKVTSGRCSTYIEGVKKAKEIISDVPVFCGVIGPYSLGGRLFDMTELMMECFDSPHEVKVLIDKATEFIINYIKAFKDVGADGVIIAEPAAGLLSPSLNDEFSIPFVKRIIDEVSDENFIVCYHNCGDSVINMTDSIAGLSADIYHFGNAVSLKDIIPAMPEDCIVMGNVDPVLFKTGTEEMIRDCVQKVYDECGMFDNFMISSGCDIPFDAKWENLDAYFEKVKMLYA